MAGAVKLCPCRALGCGKDRQRKAALDFQLKTSVANTLPIQRPRADLAPFRPFSPVMIEVIQAGQFFDLVAPGPPDSAHTHGIDGYSINISFVVPKT